MQSDIIKRRLNKKKIELKNENEIFQAISWHAEDIDFKDIDGENDQFKDFSKYVIKCFGVKSDGTSISVSITDFMPYFYIKVNDFWTNKEANILKEFLLNQIPDNSKHCLHSVTISKHKDFWGFTNFKEFKFAQITCINLKTLKTILYRLQTQVFIPGLGNQLFKIYESNIDPFIRFIHIADIEPTGWILIPNKKFRKNTEILPSNSEIDIDVKWNNVMKYECLESAPFLIASFDIECMSKTGDFPVPKKDYRKLATQLYDVYTSGIRKELDNYKKTIIIGNSILFAFGFHRYMKDDGSNMCFPYSRYIHTLEFKNDQMTQNSKANEKLYQKIKGLIDTQIDDFMITLEGKSPKIMKFSSKDEDFEKQRHIYIINELAHILNKSNLPEQKGDEIIQIGTTFHFYGDRKCSFKHILTLGTCDNIPGTVVDTCVNEIELLLKWRDLINTLNPDIITGFNIFGFDFTYIYERACDLGIKESFMMMSRFKDVVCVFKENKLSSSALGDNFLRFIDMHGRVLIDMMKVIQRDHKLDSYKLDFVANHFMGLQKNDVSPQEIFKLQDGSSTDRKKIAEYCVNDCELCNNLMIKLEIIANNTGMSNVCLVPLSFIFMRGQGIKIFSLVLKQCRDNGYLIPVIKKINKEDMDLFRDGDDPDSSYEGAIVLEPKEGIYIDDPVSVMDYSSLYPSSMIAENLSHDCMVIDKNYDNLPNVVYNDISYDKYAGKGDKKEKVGVDTSRFVQLPGNEKGIVPRILSKLLTARKSTRKRIENKRITFKNGKICTGMYNEKTNILITSQGTMQLDKSQIVNIEDEYNDFQKVVLDGLQNAYKVTANSLYGQMGASTSQLYLKEIAACTTATGRNMILKAKEFLEKNFEANIIYGDSVTAYTPIYIKDKNGNMDICTIETLGEKYGKSKWIPCIEFGKQSKEACEIHDLDTWTEHGWTPLKRVIRHKLAPHKKIIRIHTNTGVVDVTNDHSLLDIEGKPVLPSDISIGSSLLHHSLPHKYTNDLTSIIDSSQKDDYGNICVLEKSMLDASCIYQNASSLGYQVFIDIIQVENQDVFRLKIKNQSESNYGIENLIKIKKMYEISYDGFVYDLTTENHHFAAGLGNLIVHNTDSVFATFPNIDKNGKKLTGQSAISASINTAVEASKQFKPLLKPPHDLEYEKTFWPFILLSKKRYVGNLYEMDDKKFKQKSMGIVLKRRDNAPIVKTIYGGIIDIILNEKNIVASIEFLKRSLTDLVNGKYPLEELVITKSLRANYKNPLSIAHKVLADRMAERDPGDKPQVNDRIPFAYVQMPNNKKVLQGERIEHPNYIRKNNLKIDYNFYLTNQIMKPVNQVYGIVAEQIPGNKHNTQYYKELWTKINNDAKYKNDLKKAKIKYMDERENDVQEILFKPYIEQQNFIQKKNHSIHDYFKPTQKSNIIPPRQSREITKKEDEKRDFPRQTSLTTIKTTSKSTTPTMSSNTSSPTPRKKTSSGIDDQNLNEFIEKTESKTSQNKKPGEESRTMKEKILEMRNKKMSLKAIANELNITLYRLNKILE